jgi:hypothetical protein
MKLEPSKTLAHAWIIAVVLIVACNRRDSVQSLVQRARSVATADEWRSWAAQMTEHAKTNSTPVPRADWPEFVRRTTPDYRAWRVQLQPADTNTPSLVILVSLGGFESIGLIIGPPSYVEVAPPRYPQISEEVYPGIYVRQTH